MFEQFDDDGAPAGIDAAWTYATDLFDDATVVSFAARFTRLLGATVADPDLRVAALPLLDDVERTRSWRSVLGRNSLYTGGSPIRIPSRPQSLRPTYH